MNRNSISTAMEILSDEGDLLSDDDEPTQYIQSGGSVSGGSLDSGRHDRSIPSAADRRAHHNALERKRRDHIKDSFSSLRDSVPSLQGEKASRAQILKKAAEYIQFMRKKNTNVATDIEEIKKQNKMLEEQIRKIEKRSTGLGLSPSPSSASSTPTQALLSSSPNNNSSALYSTSVQSLLSMSGGGSVSESSSLANGVTSSTICYGDLSENSNESNATSNSDLNNALAVGVGINGVFVATGGRLTDSPVLTTSSSGATTSTVMNNSSSTPATIVRPQTRQLSSPTVQPLTTQQAQLLINGTSGPTGNVRSVVKNGSSTIIVQNPQIKSATSLTTGQHVIHVSSSNNTHHNANNSSNITATATPIIISTSLTNGTNGPMTSNGNATYTVLNAKTSGPPGAALSLAPTAANSTANGAYRTVVVQTAAAVAATQQQQQSGGGGSGGGGNTTTTPNIHIVSTIPSTYAGRAGTGTTKRFKISTTTTVDTNNLIEVNNNSTSSSLSSANTITASSSSTGTNNSNNSSAQPQTFNATSVSS